MNTQLSRYLSDDGLTQSDTAVAMGISERQVQRLEQSGLAKLRSMLEDLGLTLEDCMAGKDHEAGRYDERDMQGEEKPNWRDSAA
jgi:transcriptional regulator with XRE-family HTH domain